MSDDLSFWRNSEKVNKQIIQHFSFLGLSVARAAAKIHFAIRKMLNLIGRWLEWMVSSLVLSLLQLFFILKTTTHQTSFYILTFNSLIKSNFQIFWFIHNLHTHTYTHEHLIIRWKLINQKKSSQKNGKKKHWSKNENKFISLVVQRIGIQF